MKKALFVISIYQYSRETFPVLEHFKRRGWEVHVLVGWAGRTAIEYQEKCLERGFAIHQVPLNLKYIEVQEETSQNATEKSHQVATGGNLAKRHFESIPEAILFPGRVLSYLKRFHDIKRFSAGLITRVKPEVVFTGPYHSCGNVDEGITAFCAKRGIPKCCLPVSPYLGEKNSVKARFSNISNGMIPRTLEVDNNTANKACSILFPKWVREKGGYKIFMFEPYRMVASRISGILPDNPWQKPSEVFDGVFVESEFTRNLLLESNYPQNKIVVVGKPILDEVFDRLADIDHYKRIYREFDLSEGEEFVLFNWEPSAEHHYSSWEDHWERFSSLMECLKKTNLKVIISLHPLCNPEDYMSVEKKYGFKISLRYKIHDLYPYCSLSVSFPCSTNLMAPIFKKKLIIYDFFGMTKEDSPRAREFRIPGASYAYSAEDLYNVICKHVASESTRSKEGEINKAALPACEKIYRHVTEAFS